jgi:hypothetical protein
MLLWPGIVLQSATTDRKNLKNALRYMVQSVTESPESPESLTGTVLVKVDDECKVIGEPFSMVTAEVPQKLRLTHAITYDSSQARTLYGTVRLTQTSHPRMNLRRLIVGLGRAPLGEQLEVE